MIRARFDLITTMSNRDADRCLGYANIPQVPMAGQLINIDNEPCCVHEVSWALRTEDSGLFAYVRVVAAPKGE